MRSYPEAVVVLSNSSLNIASFYFTFSIYLFAWNNSGDYTITVIHQRVCILKFPEITHIYFLPLYKILRKDETRK